MAKTFFPQNRFHNLSALCYDFINPMLSKKQIRATIIVLISAGVLFGVWQWTGPSAVSPRTQKKSVATQRAVDKLNQQLRDLPSPFRYDRLYPWISAQSAETLCELLTQAHAILPEARERTLEIIALRLGDTAPADGWEKLQKMTPFPNPAARALLRAWSQHDFEKAQQALLEIAAPGRRAHVGAALLLERAITHPEAAATLALDPKIKLSNQQLYPIFLQWGQSAPQALVDFALKHEKAKALRSYFAYRLHTAHEAAIAQLSAMATEPRQEILSTLFGDKDFLRENTAIAAKLLEKFPQEDKEKQQNRYIALIGIEAETAPQDALKKAFALPDKKFRKNALSAVIRTIAENDMLAACDALRACYAVLPEEIAAEIFGNTLWRMEVDDPSAFFTFLMQLPQSDQVDWAKQRLFSQLNREDLAIGLSLLPSANFKNSYARRGAYTHIAGIFYKKDPGGALEWMRSLEDPEIKRTVANKFLAEVSTQNGFNQGRALYEKLSKETGLALDVSQVIRWNQKIDDTKAALDWVLSNAKGRDKNQTLRNLFGNIQKDDLPNAIALWQSLPEGNLKENILSNFTNVLSQMPSEEASQIAASLASPQIIQDIERKKLFDDIRHDFEKSVAVFADEQSIAILTGKDGQLPDYFFKRIMQADPERLWDNIQTLPDATREKMMGQYAGILAQNDPQAALSLLIENNIPPGSQNFTRVFAQWQESDPASGIAWLSSNLPPEGANVPLYEVGLSTWLTQDPEQASQWLANQAPSPARDDLVQVLVARESDNDPEGAFIWAMSMSDADRKTKAVSTLFKSWQRKDPAGANAALDAADLPQTTKQAIVKEGRAL